MFFNHLQLHTYSHTAGGELDLSRFGVMPSKQQEERGDEGVEENAKE